MPQVLAQLSRIELLARGGEGIVTVNVAAHKTTYTVPTDQLLAHKIIGVEARFTNPVGLREIVDEYGDRCQFIAGDHGRPVMRYWVLTRVNVLPLALYAVDFDLNRRGNEALGFTIRGVEATYVRRRFAAYFQHWLDFIID